MRPRLGLVCVTISKEIRYRTITRKRLLEASVDHQRVLLEVHGGKSNRSDALVSAIAQLPDAIRSRLGLENDEYSYSAEAIWQICKRSGLPMVFDAHHHVVHHKLASYEDPSVGEMLLKARETWPDPEHQLVHISNGRASFNDRQHSDLIETMPSSYASAPWIEIEAKFKEDAIRGLQPWQQAAQQ